MAFVAVMIVSLVVGLALRAGIAGETCDPRYRNIRDMGRQLIRDPVEGLRRLPENYGRYYGHYFSCGR